jgi:hypothetical protein
MKKPARISCVSLLLVSVAASAGEIYGTISQDGKPVVGRAVRITCEAATDDKATDSQGAYRVFVSATGSCKLSLPGLPGPPEATVQSYSSAQRYNFELVKSADGKPALRRK